MQATCLHILSLFVHVQQVSVLFCGQSLGQFSPRRLASHFLHRTRDFVSCTETECMQNGILTWCALTRYKKRKQIKQAASVEILMTTLRLVWLAEMFSLTGILTSVCLPANSELGKNIEGKGDKIRQYSMIAMLRVCRAGLSACYS